MAEGTSFPLPIVGSVIRWALGTNLRAIRVDDDGFLAVTFGGSVPFQVQIFGVAGDGTTLNPFRQVDFRPQQGKGTKGTVGGASARIGPLDVGKTYHIFTNVVCWLNKGDATVVAAVGDTAIQNGPVYEYIPQAAGVDDYIAFIQDTGAGDIWISRVED